MPEILPDHVPSPRTVLFWDGTAYRPGTIDAAGHVQSDVLGNANLDNALQSVHTDRLKVRGEDQLFTLKGVLANSKTGVISGAGGFYDSHAVPDGEYWVVTTIGARDDVGATTRILLNTRHDGVNSCIYDEIRAFAVGERATWSGHTYLDKDDVIRAVFIGAGAGDVCYVDLTGYRVTVET